MSRLGLVACGAIAADVRRIADRRGWDVDVLPVSALHHNRPAQIVIDARELLDRRRERYDRMAVAYGDCGTYGALDEMLAGRQVARLPVADCYDLLARDEVRAALEEEPGTYLLTDFLARTFEHTVVKELGLDRHPELRDAYFAHYTRVLWLAQRPSARTQQAAERAAALLGLPLERLDVTNQRLERELERIIDGEEGAR